MIKPFLKWAGGKSQSIEMIITAAGYFTGRFIEPFVGSGVVFLNVPATEYIISDINKDLIDVFVTLRDDDNFINDLRFYFTDEYHTQEKYYELRDKFNRSTDIKERALLFVYLNRHCFNGLCRYNKSGKFNVPCGKYKTIHFPEDSLIAVKDKLSECEVVWQGFEKTIARARLNDVIYCDPPYAPLNKAVSFTSYSNTDFNILQQETLTKLIENAPCKALISNHDTPFTRELYKNADVITTREISRTISAKATSRRKVNELLAIYRKEY